MVKASEEDDLGKNPNCLSVRILLELRCWRREPWSRWVEERDGSVIGGGLRVARLENRNNSR